jgi:hypothetical protein
MIINCAYCGKETEAKTKRKKYCSSNCRDNFGRKSRGAKKVKRKNCICCGKEFEFHRSNQKHCNSRCNHKYNFERNREKYLKIRRDKRRAITRLRKNLEPNHPLLRRPSGYGSINRDGYVIYSKNVDGIRKKVFEHRDTMEKFIGRSLKRCETIHHINGIRNDNRIENLELMASAHARGQRLVDLIPSFISFLREYGYQIIEPAEAA